MLLLVQYTLIFASVLVLVALGGCFSEHSGVINIGLEGIMVMGALGGALMMKYIPAGMAAPLVILLVVLASVLIGMIFSMLLGVAAIKFNADQTLVGTALNLLGPAAAVVLVRAINTAESVDNVSSTVAYGHSKKAFVMNIGGFEFNWFMLIALLVLIAAYIVLYKTKFGLRLCACGEHPQAADTLGINVYRMRYYGVMISGFLGGVGGAVYAQSISNNFAVTTIAGPGFIALAAMIFGRWNPVGAMLSSLFFGLSQSLAIIGKQLPLISHVPNVYLQIAPYILTIIVLAAFFGKAVAPKADGVNYIKSK